MGGRIRIRPLTIVVIGQRRKEGTKVEPANVESSEKELSVVGTPDGGRPQLLDVRRQVGKKKTKRK